MPELGRNRVRRASWIALGIMAVSAKAYACSRDPHPTPEQQFAEAAAVFVGHVTRAEEAVHKMPWGNQPVVAATVTPGEIFKGTPPAGGKVISFVFGPGNCSVPLLAGSDYVFFTDNQGFVTALDGTFSFFNIDGTEIRKEFARLRGLRESSQGK